MKYKVGDKVRIKSLDWYYDNRDRIDEVACGNTNFIPDMVKYCERIVTISSVLPTLEVYHIKEDGGMFNWTDEMIEGLVEEEVDLIPKFGEFSDNEPKDMGEVSDGYHTFNELYEYRMLYNATLFNEFAKQGLYDVHKSRKHSDGEYPFGDSNWFIVMAELPTGQISNHYEMKDWDKFQIPEKPLANKWDGHTPKDVTERLRRFLTPKSKYPKTYGECCKVLGIIGNELLFDATKATIHELKRTQVVAKLYKLLICRDAYWKIVGEKMGLGKPWEPDYTKDRYIICRLEDKILRGHRISGLIEHFILEFPTEEMRDAFYENFKDLIEECKELL